MYQSGAGYRCLNSFSPLDTLVSCPPGIYIYIYIRGHIYIQYYIYIRGYIYNIMYISGGHIYIYIIFSASSFRIPPPLPAGPARPLPPGSSPTYIL